MAKTKEDVYYTSGDEDGNFHAPSMPPTTPLYLYLGPKGKADFATILGADVPDDHPTYCHVIEDHATGGASPLVEEGGSDHAAGRVSPLVEDGRVSPLPGCVDFEQSPSIGDFLEGLSDAETEPEEYPPFAPGGKRPLQCPHTIRPPASCRVSLPPPSPVVCLPEQPPIDEEVRSIRARLDDLSREMEIVAEFFADPVRCPDASTGGQENNTVI